MLRLTPTSNRILPNCNKQIKVGVCKFKPKKLIVLWHRKLSCSLGTSGSVPVFTADPWVISPLGWRGAPGTLEGVLCSSLPCAGGTICRQYATKHSHHGGGHIYPPAGQHPISIPNDFPFVQFVQRGQSYPILSNPQEGK